MESPWIEFADQLGLGWAQPDALVFWDDPAAVLVVEAKLTHCLDARLQLLGLYGPLVQNLWPRRKVHLLVACRHIRLDLDAVRVEGPENFHLWKGTAVHLWHWRGYEKEA